MNRLITILLLIAVACYADAKEYVVGSPDGHIKVRVNTGKDLTYSVERDNTLLIAPSEIGLTLANGRIWGPNSSFSASQRCVDKTYATQVFKRAMVRDYFNELLLKASDFSLCFRVYDDGVAWRFIPKKAITVKAELATFVFAEDWQAYIPYVSQNTKTLESQFHNSFESLYDHHSLSQWNKERLAFLPITVEAANGIKLCMVESDLLDYPGMFLYNGEGGRTLKGVFAPVPDETKQGGYNNLQREVKTRKNVIAENTKVLPWRGIVIATEDKQLAQSDFTWRLATPQDNRDWSWVRPGKVAWDWWNNWNIYGVDFEAGINNDTYKYYIDFAASKGIEYVILDDGWSVPGKADLMQIIPQIDIPMLAKYAEEKGVGLILWAGHMAFDRNMEEVCEHYSKLGIKGWKIDFMDYDDQQIVQFYRRAAETTAKYHMLADFHGAFKPAGLQRTYPNVVNFEGIFGLENMKWAPSTIDQITYDVTIPFARLVAGSADYTQGAMRNAAKGCYSPNNSEPMSQGTRCHQLAEYIVFDAPLTMLCDAPSNYLQEPECTDFIAGVPTVWDETIALDGKIGEYVVLARRKGSQWFVGALNGLEARDLTLDLSFIPKGKAVVFADGKNAHRAGRDYQRQDMTITDKVTIHLAPGGGWVMQTIPIVGQKVAALDAAAWESSIWISAANAPTTRGRADRILRAADGASWFVSTIKNEKKVVSAKWMTAGLGVYELYLNGQPIGKEILKPGFTHYAKTKRSFTYDITEAFQKQEGSENQLSAQVTPGWWADKIITPGETDGMIGKKCAFRGVLELTFADGTKKRYGTNCIDWKAGIAGPVKHAGIFDGEEYDARELPGFATIEMLSKPEPNEEFKGEILPSEGAEVYLRQDLALKPVMSYVWEGVSGEKQAEERKEIEYGKVNIKRNYTAGETIILNPGETLVVDFGQNCSGVPSFTFKAKEGTKLTCLPAEILNDGNGAERRGMDGPEGSVHRRNLRIQDNCVRIDYTFGNSNGFVNYYPHCTFFGFRYVSITATDEVKIQKIELLPISSIAKDLEIGTITTGHELINKLISNTLWGQRSNYLSVPTDCPQRDERLGWMADTQVFTETGTFFANTDRFFHKWTCDVRDSQSDTGGFPGVAPTAQYGNEMMRLGWADAGIIVPWTIWKQYGDKAIINENWEAMARFVDHINEVKYSHEALVKENGNYQWADWLSCEALETCINLAFDENWKPRPDAITYWNYLSANYWLIDAEMMRDMAKATGRDAATYQQMVDAARAYLKDQFLDDQGCFKCAVLNTMQTPALFALKNQLVEGEAKEQMIARLRQNFLDHGNCLQTGFLGTSILMATLTENGMSDIAYELLFQRKNPSWIYSIDNGATTIWERWNSYRIDEGLGPNGMNSFNHYAYGAVCEWIWETVAGISADVNSPGFRHIMMKPIPDKRLGFVKAEYNSAAGIIKSAWKYEGNKWIWDFTIPEGATATVILPGETTSKEYKSGTYQICL